MRTTVNLRDEALELSKAKAREQNRTLGDVISEAILTVYRARPSEGRVTPYELPVAGEGGLKPGVDLDSWSALEDLLEGRA